MLTLGNRLGLALAISFVAVACATPTIPNQTGDEGDGTSDPAESASSKKAAPKKPSTTKPTTPAEGDASAATPNPSPTPTTNPTPTGGNCKATAGGQACFQCCDQASGGSLAKADNAYFACACDQGGQCATTCAATMCQDQQPSAACDTCLQQKCEPAADALCTSAACKAGQQCLQTDCAGKQ